MSDITGYKKKILILSILAAGLVTASLVTAASFASAQNATNLIGNGTANGATTTTAPQVTVPPAGTSSNSTQAAATKIVGTINVRQAAKNLMSDSVKVTLAEASSKAASQVVNGTAVKGCLGVVQGYLVYTITVENMNSGTHQKVIVDAGNGSVLYTAPPSYTGHSVSGMIDGYFAHHHRHHHHYHHHY
ncbi:MAG TPA: PepSY domain-containing protein [Nitrososphaera sp.]|nr:PepSY domain-containing protein [Nitrososphaera sp.]